MFHTPEEAACAYDAAARSLHGKSARLNFPHGTTAPAPRVSARLDFPHGATAAAPEGSERLTGESSASTLSFEGSSRFNLPDGNTALPVSSELSMMRVFCDEDTFLGLSPEGSPRLLDANTLRELSEISALLDSPDFDTPLALPSEWSRQRNFSDVITALEQSTSDGFTPLNFPDEIIAPAPLSEDRSRVDAPQAGMTVALREPAGAALSAASIRADATEVVSPADTPQTGLPTVATGHHPQLHPGGDEEDHQRPQLRVDLGSQRSPQYCASLGALGSLLGKLHALLAPGCRQLPKMVKDGMQTLKDDLEEISTYLEDLSEVEDPLLTVKCWMKEVRELSYDIEDYIDKFVHPLFRAKIKNRFIRKTRLVKITPLPKRLNRHKKIANMMSDFRIYVREAIERHGSYELDCYTFRRRFVSPGPMLPAMPYEETDDLVIDGQMSEFMGSLASDGDHQLKVVSVVGPGCLGKTTLAKVFYNKFGRQFDCRAFIRVSRKPDMNRILRDMLWQLQRQQPPDDCKELDIIDNIRKHLRDKRYLLIIDDLWAASVWDIIKHAFPKGSQGSRIITTTQIEDVASSCCCYRSDYVFEMKPLDDYHSRKLFFSRISGSESDCPQQFKQVANEIVGICGGLPLATISIASLLASHPVISMDLLMHIRDSLNFCLSVNSTSEGMRQVLNFSYNNLPRYLKTCLLYLSIYSEGSTIWKDDLVNQWIAEGFVNTAEGQDMEKVAGSYFNELIDRRFIQPVRVNNNNEVLSCTVHDMVHDLIAHKCADENFILVTDHHRKNMALSDNVHRLSLRFGHAEHAKLPENIRTSQVRSLAFSGSPKCMPSVTEFKLVHVLNLELSGHHGDGRKLDLTGISELFQLRYLKVASACNVWIELPNHMRGLQCLETLDVNAKVSAVPWDIIQLPRLLHLRLPVEASLFDWIGSMRSVSLWSLAKLNHLRDLHLLSCSTASSRHLQRSCVEALGSLLNLKTLSLSPVSFRETAAARGASQAVIVPWHGFAPPSRLLERFEWSLHSYIFHRVPTWMGELANLCILKIGVRFLLTHDTHILARLPALASLSLYARTVPADRIIFGKAGGFPALRYFKFRCRTVPWLKFEADTMPSLHRLKLRFDAPIYPSQALGIPVIIEHLPCLKEISAKIGGADGGDAESALAISVSNDPRNPDVQLLGSIFQGQRQKTPEEQRWDPGVWDPSPVR